MSDPDKPASLRQLDERVMTLRDEMKAMEGRLVLLVADSAQRTLDIMATMERRLQEQIVGVGDQLRRELGMDLRRELGMDLQRHSDSLFERMVDLFRGANDQTRALGDRITTQELRLDEHVADDSRHRKRAPARRR